VYFDIVSRLVKQNPAVVVVVVVVVVAVVVVVVVVLRWTPLTLHAFHRFASAECPMMQSCYETCTGKQVIVIP